MTAADILMQYTEQDLRLVFGNYGELPKTHRFVTAVMEARSQKPLRTADDLNSIIENLYRRDAKKSNRQIYQALRIEANSEMQAVEQLLSIRTVAPETGDAWRTHVPLAGRPPRQTRIQITVRRRRRPHRCRFDLAHFLLLTRHALKPSDGNRNNPRTQCLICDAIARL